MPGIDPNIALQVQTPKPINPLADFAQIMQLRQAQQLIPLKIQEAQQNAEENTLKLDEMRRAIADRGKINAAYAASIVPDEKTGAPTTNRDKLTRAFVENGIADKLPAALEGLDKIDKGHQELIEQRNKIRDANTEYGAGLGAAVRASGNNPDFYRQQITTSMANGDVDPNTGKQLLAQLDQLKQQDPTGKLETEFTKQHADTLIGQSEKMVTSQSRATTAATGAAKLPGELAQQQAALQNTRAQAKFNELKAAGNEPIQPVDLARQAFEQRRLDQELDRSLESARHNAADENETRRYHNLSVEGVSLTPQAKQKMAEMFASTGVLPALGMGKAAAQNRSDIINQAAKDFPAVDFATNKASYQANTASLKKLQSTSDTVDAFENTAGKNIDLFLKTASKIVDTGSPLLNAPVRMLSDKVFGSENMSAFKAARETALTEAAKVLESPQGGNALTVSGREAVKTLSDPNATLKQQVNSMKILRSDMANRKQSNVEEIAAIKDRIGQANPNAPRSTAGGKIIVTAPDGSTHPFDTQAQADAFKKLANIQ